MEPSLEDMKDKDGSLPAWAWSGGYPIIYSTKDGLTICPKCANREVDDCQQVIGGDVYWEGPPIQCGDNGGWMESAYGDPDDKDE